MTNSDFLRYNYSELVELGKHGSHAQRSWLKSYLKQYATNSERQQKLATLVK